MTEGDGSLLSVLEDQIEGGGEVQSENARTRREIAASRRNRYGSDILSSVLEEYAGYDGVLVIEHGSVKKEGMTVERYARVLGEKDAREIVDKLTGDRVISRLVNESKVVLTGGIPEGMRFLSHKISHARIGGFDTRFRRYMGEKFDESSISRLKPIVDGLIRDIMSKPGTIILHGKTVDIFDSGGRGVKIERNFESTKDPLMKAFLDSASACHPDQRTFNYELQQGVSVNGAN
jgi:hypothetical protein